MMRLPFWAIVSQAALLFHCIGAGPSSTDPATATTTSSPIPSTSSISASEIIAKFPRCAIPCVTSVIANSTCSPDDIPCLCSDKRAIGAASVCVEDRCPLADALVTKNATQTACHAPIRDRSGEFKNIVIACGVVTIVITVTRLIFKQFFHPAKKLGADDWAIFGTLAICITGMVIGIQGLTANGLGKDVWTLQTSEISQFVLYFYVLEILYLAGMSLVKLSISLFYMNLFAATVAPAVLWATVIFNILYGLIFITGAIFQCTPVDFYWRQYLDTSDGHCININLFGWLNAGIGIVIDLWMIILPMSQVLPLRLHWKKKIGVAIMLLLGTFVTVVSALRLQSLIHFANSNNPTWDQWATAYWSVLEVNVGMICSCLPSLRLILVRLCPSIFGSSSSSSYHQELGPAGKSFHRSKVARTEDDTESHRYIMDLDER